MVSSLLGIVVFTMYDQLIQVLLLQVLPPNYDEQFNGSQPLVQSFMYLTLLSVPQLPIFKSFVCDQSGGA
jgi:hypothetical protein